MRFLNRYTRLEGPDAEKTIVRSPMEIEFTQACRKRGRASDFSPIRVAVHYTGTVQGVGFRWTTQNIAHERNITGWVINRKDGSVDAELQGPAVQIAALIDDIQESYAGWGMRIWLERAEELEVAPEETDFEVRL